MNNSKKFYLSAWVQGYVRLSVASENEKEAIEKMEQYLCDADFGPLEDID